MKLTDKFLAKKVNYGGEMIPLGQVWADILTVAPNVKCAERYIQGLLLRQELDKKCKDGSLTGPGMGLRGEYYGS